MTNKKTTIQTWLSSNLWNLIVTTALIIGAFVLMQYRVDALEKKLAEYPSEDYFDLKFQTIDEKLSNLDTSINEVKKDLKYHIEE